MGKIIDRVRARKQTLLERRRQIEIGLVAPPFDHVPYEVEEERCKRYFEAQPILKFPPDDLEWPCKFTALSPFRRNVK